MCIIFLDYILWSIFEKKSLRVYEFNFSPLFIYIIFFQFFHLLFWFISHLVRICPQFFHKSLNDLFSGILWVWEHFFYLICEWIIASLYLETLNYNFSFSKHMQMWFPCVKHLWKEEMYDKFVSPPFVCYLLVSVL